MSEMSLSVLWNCDLEKHNEEVTAVMAAAQGEMALDEFFKSVRDFWSGFEMELTVYKNKAKLIQEKIKNKVFEIKKLSTENKELYGSVKPTEISKLLEENLKIEINPSQIQPIKEIKSLGDFKVMINLHSEVQEQIIVKVVSEEETK